MFVFFTPETLASSHRDCVSLKKNLMDIGMRNQAVAGELLVFYATISLCLAIEKKPTILFSAHFACACIITEAAQFP